MNDFPEMPEFLKRGPDTPELKAARIAAIQSGRVVKYDTRTMTPAERKRREADNEAEREATLERWRKEHLAEQIAESKRST